MIKLLIGGSPCTYWSIAQKNNRETKADGIGWELFKNYLIAKEKFKPDFFLYENNKSASSDIKAQIREELGVSDSVQLDMFHEDTGARYIEINSALVSAQNRQRFYVHNCGNVEQPEDRGILLRDILEYGVTDKGKAYFLKHQAGNARDYFKKHHTQVAFVPVCLMPVNDKNGKSQTIKAQYMNSNESNFCCYKSTFGATGVAVPVNPLRNGKGRCVTSVYSCKGAAHVLESNYSDDPNKQKWDSIAEPVRVCSLPRPNGELSTSQAMRVYSIDGKSVTLSAGGGGLGGKTGLYAFPVCNCECGYAIACDFDENGNPLKALCQTDGKTYNVHRVKNGMIELHGQYYPSSLSDGYWIIRKLTVAECCRLQTLPDDYCRSVSDTQAYKGIGNGWTAEVIIHILNGALKDVPRDEKILVLSMYDGIGTGRYCLDKMGFTNVEYHAYEIDKYAMKIAQSNYPDIIQHGDAFALREDGWKI